MTLRWQPVRQPRRLRKFTRVALALSLMTAGLLALSVRPGVPVIVYNPTPSAPLGYYRTLPSAPLEQGDWVLIEAPYFARLLADQRGYLPMKVPMIKTIAAMPGDQVCAKADEISINGLIVANRLRIDHRGRPLPRWTGCRTLAADEVFVLNRAARNSFDGRYFGVISKASVRARLVHL